MSDTASVHFQNIENEFSTLRRAYFQGRISEREFKDRLKKLRFKDKQGRCWTIGARTGKWYFYNGSAWVESRPPSLQSGRAICIYCGYENDLEDEACGYCGGNLEGGKYSCPKCGTRLKSPTQPCPRCESGEQTPTSLPDFEPPSIPSPDFEAEPGGREDEDSPDEPGPVDREFEDIDSALRGEEEALADDGGPNYVVRALNPFSFLIFGGGMGLVLGLLFGVLAGTLDIFRPVAARLPVFLQALQGKMIGGLVYGLLGGAAGFALLGILGMVLSIPVNLILSLMGGFRLRLERY